MYHPVPAEPLWNVFTPAVLAKLQRVTTPSPALTWRLRVLGADGLSPDDSPRAHKSAWEVYLLAAFACGLFEGHHGTELRARLTGVNDDNFRSALDECLATWYLAGPRKLQIEPRPEGRSDHALEFALKLPEGDIKVEVKSPFRPITSDFWRGMTLTSWRGHYRTQTSSSSRPIAICLSSSRVFACQYSRSEIAGRSKELLSAGM